MARPSLRSASAIGLAARLPVFWSCEEAGALRDAQPQPEAHHADQEAAQERHPPAPGRQLRFGKQPGA